MLFYHVLDHVIKLCLLFVIFFFCHNVLVFGHFVSVYGNFASLLWLLCVSILTFFLFLI